MNIAALSGRLTKAPTTRYGGQDNSVAITRFTLAVDDVGGADFINIAWGVQRNGRKSG